MKLAFGTDWFVAPLNPMETIYAAVTRATLDGKRPGGWFPEQKLTVVDAWSLETHKTKALRATLDKLNGDRTILLVDNGTNRNLELASRNLEGVKLVAPNVLQPYDLLRHDRLIFSKDAVARVSHSLDPNKVPAEAPHVETIAPAPAPKKKQAAPKAAAKKAKTAARATKKAAKPGKSKGKD